MARMSLQAAYDQARQWLESNDLDRAAGLAQHILEHYPNNLEAYRILGEAQLANRQLDQAQAAFERVLRADPENIPAHVGLGITFERHGQLDRAVAEFEQALEIKPDMPELRSQLLRLYADAWGSENAQLRLSRAGLARLYAKGHMLPQAIAEFRQVIAEHPERFDARVALAETLWRNEQEEDAVEACRAILEERPETLKANLILGYIELAAGNPEGERYWRAAYEMDPYQTVARALFETLPPMGDEEPTIPEWDEEAWRRRMEVAQEEPLAATRPMESYAAAADDERDTPVFSQAPAAAVATGTGPSGAAQQEDEDDFLASLLALDVAPAPSELAEPAPSEQPAEDLAPGPMDTTQFSLEELGIDDVAAAAPESGRAEEPAAASGTPSADAERLSDDDLQIDMQPFSLADLGLSDEEIAGLESIGAISEPQAAAETPSSEEQAGDEEAELDMQPFSLADLGLSDEEIAGLESIGAISAEPQAAAETPSSEEQAGDEEAELDMQPFSLADLGLSDEEIAGLQNLQSAEAADAGEEAAEDVLGDLPADLQPFSIDELDLGASDAGKGELGELPPSLQPFSLEEPPQPQRPPMSGLGSEEPIEGASEEDEALPGPRGFSWQQPTQRPEPGFVSSMRVQPEPMQGSIFEKLRQQRQAAPPPPPEEPPQVVVGEDEHMGLFSLDDVSLRDDEGHDVTEPPAAPEAAVPEAAAPEASAPETSAPETSAPETAEVEDLQEALASGVIQPFSFADLGLSEEEIAALGLAEQATGESQAPEAAPAEPVAEPAEEEPVEAAEAAAPEVSAPEASTPETPAPETAEVEDLQEALASGVIQPFSFADLGLSEEEIAALGLAEQTTGESQAPEAAPAEPVAEPAEEEPVGSAEAAAPEAAAPEAAAPEASAPETAEVEDLQEALASGVIQPFSFADLGLSEEELAALGLSEGSAETPAEQAAEAPAADAESDEPVLDADLRPFSLADLGLSDEEIEDLNLDTAYDDADETRLGLTEEELAGLDLGGDVDWSKVSPPPDTPPAQPEQVISGDLVIDRLIALGREQGFVDISDIIGAVADPEAEAARIEEIGRALHAAKIEIRDGDEVVDMDAEYEEEEQPSAEPAPETSPPTATVAGEEVTPFSLRDLGLSDEEIAMLGLGAEEGQPAEAAGDAGQIAAQEPSSLPGEAPTMEPFSLSDLGLSDSEPEPAETAEATLPPEPPSAPADEQPALEPFSLGELGLTEEEIASLGLSEDATATPSPVPGEAAAPDVSADPAERLAEAQPEAAAAQPAPAPQPSASDRGDAGGASSAERQRPPATTGNDLLDTFLRQLEEEPDNHVLRLSIARAGEQFGLPDLAVQQYRDLIKRGALLDEVVADLSDLIAEHEDEQTLRRLHRTLGDAYSKLGRFREAMEEYSWISGSPRAAK